MVPVPVAPGIVYKTSGGCRAFQSSCRLLSRSYSLSLSLLLWLSICSLSYLHASLLVRETVHASPSLLRFLSLFVLSPMPLPILFLQQPDARQQGRLYVLPSLSVARLARRFSIYFRISPRATRCNPAPRALSQCNTIKSKLPTSCHWSDPGVCA